MSIGQPLIFYLDLSKYSRSRKKNLLETWNWSRCVEEEIRWQLQVITLLLTTNEIVLHQFK